MLGTRHGPTGSNRPAWAHPEDVVALLCTFWSSTPFDVAMIDIAWLHDILEDGRKLDGSKITVADLEAEGVEPHVIKSVVALTHHEGEEKITYLARLENTLFVDECILKCLDRICNLREGKDTFKEKRWARYVDETQRYIMPLVEKIPSPERAWFKEKLDQALAARPVLDV